MLKRKVSISVEGKAALIALLGDMTYELIPLSNVLAQSEYLPEGARVSVTASPAKGMQATVDLALELQQRGFDVVPHISARLTQDRAELESILKQVTGAEIKKAFVVGGDADPPGEFFDGLSILKAMGEIGHDLTIGIPSYPEGHHFISDEAINEALVYKQPYASSMTTQMCFKPQTIADWIGEQRARGVELPIAVGIPGVAELRKLIGISARIGVGDSMKFLTKNTNLVGKLVRPGGYSPDDLLMGLSGVFADDYSNVIDLHCYTFNQVESTEDWRHKMLESLA